MPDDDFFLCSELVKVSAGQATLIGNLEQISSAECLVTLDASLTIDSDVRMQCLACPQGKKRCTECRFRGKVRDRQTDPLLGCLTRIEFEGRTWSQEEWHPSHLVNTKVFRSRKRSAQGKPVTSIPRAE